MSLLDTISGPRDVKRLDRDQLPELAAEIRARLIDCCSVTGGHIGASLGVLIVVAVSAIEVWTPVLDPAAPLLAPLVGGLIGLLSGTSPALRAARLEPVEAFRH